MTNVYRAVLFLKFDYNVYVAITIHSFFAVSTVFSVLLLGYFPLGTFARTFIAALHADRVVVLYTE